MNVSHCVVGRAVLRRADDAMVDRASGAEDVRGRVLVLVRSDVVLGIAWASLSEGVVVGAVTPESQGLLHADKVARQNRAGAQKVCVFFALLVLVRGRVQVDFHGDVGSRRAVDRGPRTMRLR